MDVIGAATALSLLTIALIDGASNAASFISIAMGSNELKPGKIMLCASVGEAVGVIVLGSRLYTGILGRASPSSGEVDVQTVALGLGIALLWTLYALITKAVAPVSVAILGVLLGASANSLSLFLSMVALYACLWIAQMGVAAAVTAALVRARPRLGLGLDLVTLAVPLLALSLAVSRVYDLDAGQALTLSPLLVTAVVFVAKKLNKLDRVSIAVPLLVAAVAHGMNDSALMLGVAGLSSFSRGSPQLLCYPISMLMVLGLVLWSRRLSAVLAKSITLIDAATAKSLYLSLFATTAAFNLLGLPAPATFSTLGSFLGIGIGRGLRVLNVRAVAKLIAIALATLVAVSIPLQVAKLLTR